MPGPSLPAARLMALALASSVLLGVIAVAHQAMALGIALGLVFIVVTFRNLAVGLALFTLVISLEYVPGMESGVALAKPTGAVLAAAWAAELIARQDDTRSLYRDRPVLAGAAIGISVWALASSLWAVDGGVAVSSAVRLAQGIILLFVVYTALRTFRDVRLVLGAYVLGALLAMLAGIGTSSGGGVRLGGGVGNPNELAAVLVPAVMICAFALLAERRPLARWAIGVVGLVLLVGLFMTGSRGGLVGMTVAVVAAIILAGRARMTILAATLVILGAGIAYYTAFAPRDQVDRLLSARADRGTGREDIWTVALQVVRDKPFKGAGAGNFTVVAPSYAAGDINIKRVDFVVDQPKVVHNTYLEILAELGVVGAVLFGLVVVGALASAFSAIRRARVCPWEVQLQVRGFAVGLLGILSVYFFGSREYNKQLWLLLGIALALPLVVERLAASSRAKDGDEARVPARTEPAPLRIRHAEL